MGVANWEWHGNLHSYFIYHPSPLLHAHRDKGKDEVTKVRKPRERKTKAEEEEEEAEEEGEWQTVQRKSHDQLSHKVSCDVQSRSQASPNFPSLAVQKSRRGLRVGREPGSEATISGHC